MMSHHHLVATADLPIARNTRPDSLCSLCNRSGERAGSPARAGVSMRQPFRDDGAARAALYITMGAKVLTSARYAERVGLRVVTMLGEESTAPLAGLAGSRLNALMDRLGCGEFEVIVAGVGEGRVFTIAAAPIEDYVLEEQLTDVRATHSVESPQACMAAIDAGSVAGMALRCAIYASCASTIHSDREPLAGQVGTCKAYAKEKGWEPVSVHDDLGTSGMTLTRPALDQLRKAAQGGAFDILLVEEFTRLSRDSGDARFLIKEMDHLGVQVHTVGGHRITALEAAIGFELQARAENQKATRARLRASRKLRSSRHEADRGVGVG